MLEGNTGAQGAGQGSQFRGWVSSFRQGLRRCKGFLGAGPGYHIHIGSGARPVIVIRDHCVNRGYSGVFYLVGETR